MNTKKEKIYFVLSDVHSFYRGFLSTLKKLGYNPSNEQHYLILTGDLFDRGPSTVLLYKYLTAKVDQHRLILVRGNHESLFNQLKNKSVPDDYDYSNGTVSTFCQIGNWLDGKRVEDYSPVMLDSLCWHGYLSFLQVWHHLRVDCVIGSPIDKFINCVEKWRDYYQIPGTPVICTHAFIPFVYTADWRNASSSEWERARWVEPYYAYRRYQSWKCKHAVPHKDECEIFITGHFATYHAFLTQEDCPQPIPKDDKARVFYTVSKDGLTGLIGIDGGVYYKGRSDTLRHKQLGLKIAVSENNSYTVQDQDGNTIL